MPDIKKKAEAFANAAAGRARTFAGFAVRKTKTVSRIAKLNVDIAGERDTIKRAYSEIGKLYYETHKDDPETFFVQLCQEIENSYEAIAAMESEIVRLKTTPAEDEAAEPDDTPAAGDGEPDASDEPRNDGGPDETEAPGD